MIQTTFVRYNKNKFEEFTKALETGDIKLAHRIAHTLKSNGGQLGKTGLQKIAAEVESLLKDGTNQTTKRHLEVLETELKAVLEEYAPLLVEVEALPKGTVLDKEKAKELVKEMEPLLKGGNPKCLKFLDDLRRIPGTEELVQQMDDFDFEKATATLAKLVKSWQ
jgi:HPt (histidine-containing phosphotransfer) domain-containing protein